MYVYDVWNSLPGANTVYESNSRLVGCQCCNRWPHLLIGDAPFAGINAGSALAMLRSLLGWLDVPDAGAYRTHDLRRGHAKDLQVSGAGLAEILAAGQWRSPAFLQYLDIEKLELDAVVEAHVDESGDED